ncbi:ATP-binding protein [Bradyrhizobium cosmicum]|uniref:sensor histidine kinase n=1 Tax=Bradyrhizobium cosmicum TaxID=1404864 RepID=UPI0028E7674A|nr:ATP-binding protein [Bradyrhizobium cosmicum]
MLVFGILFLVVVLFSPATRADGKARRVLILHSYNYTFPADAAISESLRKELARSSQPIEVEAEFLDLARRPDEVEGLKTAKFLGEKYAAEHFDAIVVIGIPGMPFLLKHRDLIAPGVPIVWADVTRTTLEAAKLPADITAVINDYIPEKTLELAERLQPKARRLVVIGGASTSDVRWQENGRRAVAAHNSSELEVEYWLEHTYSGLLEHVSELPRDTIVLLLTFFADREDKRFIPRDVAGAVAEASAAPVYGFFETYLGTGVVGGYLETYQSIGATTAGIVLEILSGKDITKLSPRDNAKPAFRVDARAMERWGLDRKNLPSRSTVLFQKPSLWEEHRYLFSASAAVVAVQSFIVAGLLFQRRRRQQAEQSLKESEDRMRFAAASANIGLWQFDRATSQLWSTEHCRAIFGLSAGFPLTCQTFLAAIHPDDRSMAAAALQGELKGGRSAIADVRTVSGPDEVRWVRIRARSDGSGQNTAGQLSGMFADITDQKTAECDLELQRQEVAHLMRVTALGELSGAIAHEVNQPLTAILSNAQAALYLLKQDSPNFTEIHDALQDIVHEDNRASEVIQRLRSLLKKGESSFDSIDLNELVESTVALLRHQLIDRRVTAETDLALGLPTVLGDPVQLQQVLLNLIMNAMDAMTSTPDAQRRIQICTRATEKGTIEVYLKDNGPGIKTVDRKRVFVPFYTTKDQGLGLGLSICSTIIEKHGGTINLRNADIGGAVAEISLPAEKGPHYHARLAI